LPPLNGRIIVKLERVNSSSSRVDKTNWFV